MSTKHTRRPNLLDTAFCSTVVLAAISLLTTPCLTAQLITQPASASQEAFLALPDAPSSSRAAVLDAEAASSAGEDAPAHPVMASPRAELIFPNQTAPQLSATDKVYMGLIHGVSLYSALGWVLAAEYQQVTNGTPNFGTDSGAYGQRLGAAALRGYTEEVFATSVLAPILHEDPRYYKMGPRRNVAVRTVYSVTRTIITRDDRGHLTPNFSLVGGNLAGATLTNAYYPEFNRGFNQTLKTFEGSMAGSAFSFFADEFLKDKLLAKTLVAVHLRHR